jgi:hypothetical protein
MLDKTSKDPVSIMLIYLPKYIQLSQLKVIVGYFQELNLPSNVILVSCETEEGFPLLLGQMQQRLGQL